MNAEIFLITAIQLVFICYVFAYFSLAPIVLKIRDRIRIQKTNEVKKQLSSLKLKHYNIANQLLKIKYGTKDANELSVQMKELNKKILNLQHLLSRNSNY